MRDKSSVPGAAPAFNVTGELRPAHDVAWRPILFAEGRQALIQHFPENRFIFSHERTNYVIHDNWYRIAMVAEYERNTSARSSIRCCNAVCVWVASAPQGEGGMRVIEVATKAFPVTNPSLRSS